jgi:hypothetical protein
LQKINFTKVKIFIADLSNAVGTTYTFCGLGGQMASEVRFSRQPYTVKYYDQHHVLQTIQRRPPEKIHDILPTDRVKLTAQKNDDWRAGKTYTAKYINPHHANIIQIENSAGDATFVSALDLIMDEKIARRNGVDPRDEEASNEYLLWP